jgi:hypothetical protein
VSKIFLCFLGSIGAEGNSLLVAVCEVTTTSAIRTHANYNNIAPERYIGGWNRVLIERGLPRDVQCSFLSDFHFHNTFIPTYYLLVISCCGGDRGVSIPNGQYDTGIDGGAESGGSNCTFDNHTNTDSRLKIASTNRGIKSIVAN